MKRPRIRFPRVPGTLGKLDPIKARRKTDPHYDRAVRAHEEDRLLEIGVEELAAQYRRGIR